MVLTSLLGTRSYYFSTHGVMVDASYHGLPALSVTDAGGTSGSSSLLRILNAIRTQLKLISQPFDSPPPRLHHMRRITLW